VVDYQLALLDLTDAAGLLPGRAGLNFDSAVPLAAPESADPGPADDAFLRMPPLLQAMAPETPPPPAPLVR
jgi:hypothetical protein